MKYLVVTRNSSSPLEFTIRIFSTTNKAEAYRAECSKYFKVSKTIPLPSSVSRKFLGQLLDSLNEMG